MGSPGVRCDWQIDKKKMKERTKHLLETEQWSDCSFIVGTESNQKVFNVHKLFLAMSSPVFEAMFFGGMPERNDPISISDVQPDSFKALLDYIYTDKVDLLTFDQACELCYAAKKYMLPDLVDKCTNYLYNNLLPRNACKAYEFAKLFEEPVILEKSLEIILNETESVLTDPSFEDIELGTLLVILEKQTLNISSERDLFNAVFRWANKECSRKGISEDSTNLRSVIGAALEKIHFLTLTPLQFAEGPAHAPLLTRDEKYAILMNISAPGSDFPMPDGFSKVVEPRQRYRIPAPLETMPTGSGDTHREGHKYFCIRSVTPQAPCLNTGILDCCLTFTVDRNICVLGIQVPTQVQSDVHPFNNPGYFANNQNNSAPTSQNSNSYTELLYAHLLDADGSRLTYTHYTSRVWYSQLVEINFNRPVYIQRNKMYKIVVVLNKQGWYPLGSATQRMGCDAVHFSFGIGSNSESARESLVRSIVFTY